MNINWKPYTDKFRDHSYYSIYKFLLKNNPKNIFEIGVNLGAPYYYWKEFFPESKIWGIDNRTLEECARFNNTDFLPIPDDGVYLQGDIKNINLSELPTFDLILDDGSHWKEDQSFVLNTLHKKLSENGVLIIEDISSIENGEYIINNFNGDRDKLMLIDRRLVRGRSDDILIVYYNESSDGSWVIMEKDKLNINNPFPLITQKDNFSINNTLSFIKNYHHNEESKFYTYENCYISDVIKKGQIWEPFMHDVFEKYITKDSVVIEGGCHIGTHSVKLSKLSKKLHCFEPLPSSNELLKKNLQINNCNNIDVYNCGLSDNFEISDFGWIQTNNPGASFLNNNPMGLPHNSHNHNQNFKVSLITIDSLNLNQLDFIKLDVEGYEPKVINGGLNTIKKYKPIIILECWCDHNSGANSLYTENTFNMLFKIGYKMERISHSDWLFIPETI